MYYVYILKSEKDSSYYIGQTEDLKKRLEKRLEKHNKGEVKSTKNNKPYKIIYSRSYVSRSDAMKSERYLKSLKKRKYIEKFMYGDCSSNG